MKKYRHFIVPMMLAVAYSNIAMAVDLSAEFNGQVCASACTMVEAGGPTVSLGTISTKALPEVGSRASMRRFAIQFKDCPPRKKIFLSFSPGPKNNGQPGGFFRLLGIDNYGQKGVAQGVRIGLAKSNGEFLPLFEGSDDVLSDENGNAIFEFFAFYQRVGDVIPGLANSTATFTVKYEHMDN